MRIELTDGRIVEGYLQCVDGEKNFVMGQVTEIHGMEDSECFLFAPLSHQLFY